MPFVVCEDVGTTARKRLSPRDVLAAWERTKGVCVTCGERIDGVRQRWFVEHEIALENGGSDTADNRGPAHYETCKRVKDAADHSAAAQAKRRKRVQLGITAAATKPKIQSRGFAKSEPQRRASKPLTKWFGEAFPTRS
ncbi:HNH endonuclease [Methylobacterium sp. 1973]|uniref:HNH endonuclease n=1 Tax=Methylobacterium sp. 1973 TaxID=3156421 RepID=UPI00339A9021